MKRCKHSIKNKILLFFIVIMILPIITLGVFTSAVYTRVIEKKVNQHTNQMINQIQLNIENYIQSVEDIIIYISESEEVLEYNNEDTDNENMQLEVRLRKQLSLYRKANPEILGILIVNNKDKYISNDLEKNTRDPLTNEKWYKQAINSPNEVQFYSNPIGRNITSYLQYSADDVFTIVKAMKDNKSGEVKGVVLIDINLKKIEDIIEDNYIGKKGFFYILDKNNKVVYSPINPIIYRIKTDYFNENSSNIIKVINDETFKIMYNTSNITGWKTIGVFSLKEILQDVTAVQRFTVVVVIITAVLAVISAILFTNSIVTPINELNKLMKKVESGDLESKFDNKKYKDEFGKLGESFNHMIEEIKKLIEMVYKEQREKRKAEIEIFQAQIKPHFLYNTLDTIGWMAEDYGAKDIVTIVTALTKVFRIALSKGREIILVKEEIEHINSYMIIQKVRYEDKVDYIINYDEDILNSQILKLIIQPIVENAIYHGLKQKRGKGFIEIEFRKLENNILIKISDNGAGIDEDKLSEINTMLNSDNICSVTSENGSGYGVYNVNTRIKYTYGAKYGLKYFSEVAKGTTVEIRIPIIK